MTISHSAGLAATLALLLSSASAFGADTLADRIRKVETGLVPGIVLKGTPIPTSSLEARMKELHVPGVSVAVINHGVIEWARGYGVADASSNKPVTTDTLFQAASISKPVTAMAALRLVEQGKLSLDDDVNRALKSWQVPAGAQSADAPVTLRGLLSHSAGATVPGFGGYAAGESVPTVLQVLAGVAPANSKPVLIDTRPGTRYRYSGGGFTIAQLLMTEAAGQPFAPLMEQNVLRPLGMKRSTYAQPLPAALQANAASGHDPAGQPVPGKWQVHPEQAAAGLWSTPTDLARFVIEVQRARAGKSTKVISQAAATRMLTRVKGDYGLGMGLDDADGVATFNHSGSNVGFRTYMVGLTGSGQGAVVMTNGDNGGAITEELMRSVAAAYGWNTWKVDQKVSVPVDAATLAAYAGNFRVHSTPIVVTHEGGQLVVKAPPLGERPRAFHASSPTRFFNLEDGIEMEFQKNASGQFDLIIIDGERRPATRVP